MKKCPKCNFENQDNSQFCQNCGTPLSAQTHTQSVSHQNKEKWYQRTAFTVIMLILLIQTLPDKEIERLYFYIKELYFS